MPPQDGLRFLFDITDKISAKLAKIEAKATRSAAKIDKAFTRASKSQQANSAKAIASEQRRIVAVEKSHAKAINLLQRESDAFKRSMGRMAAAASVAFAAVAGKAIQMAGGYDLAMRSVQAKTGATGELMDRLSEQSREMGRTTVHSATEAARGQAFLAQAGFDVHEVLEALPATLALATSGELDLASAADIASNVLSGFRLETDQAARVADVLAKAADSSNTNVAQLGAALAKAAPSAAAAGWSLEETAAAIGKLSDAGIQGEEAGTALKTMMAKLAIDGGPAEKLMAKMGITVKDTTGQMLPLNDILTALAPHANDVGLQFELLGTRGGNAGLVLGAVAQDSRALTDELIDSAGWAQKNADIMGGGLWGAIKKIQSIIESAYISFGERFTPAIQLLAKVFGKLPSPIQEVVVVVGSLAGAMGGLMVMMPGVFGAITTLPGKLGKLTAAIRTTIFSTKGLTAAFKTAWRALMGPVGWVIAIAAATVGLYKFWKATNAPEKKLAKLEKRLMETNRRLMEFADTSPRLVEELGHQKDAIERQIAALKKSHPELERAEEDLAALADTSSDVVDALTPVPPIIIETGDAAAEAAVKLKPLTSNLSEFNRIQSDFHNLTATTIDQLMSSQGLVGGFQQAAAGAVLASTEIKTGLMTLPPAIKSVRVELDDTEQSSGNLDVTLASLAGQMGGAAGQSINLFNAMRQTNAELKEGEKGFSKMQMGAALVGGALQELAGEVDGVAGKILQGAANIASAFATGGPVAGAIAAAMEWFKAWGNLINEWFNGAQMRFNKLTNAVNDSLSAIREGTLTVEEAWGKATHWIGNEEGFERLRAISDMFIEAGLSAEEATAWATRFNAANKSQDATALKALLVEYEKIARQAEVLTAALAGVISAYDRAKKAGSDAYDKIYSAAIKSGVGQEEAVARATAAQEEASAKILAIEKAKFIRIARFEAALFEIRNGNALGATAAADKAASDTAKAWDISLAAVTKADDIAGQAMKESSKTTADKAIEDADRMAKDVQQLHEDLATKAIYEAERAADQAIIEAERLATGVRGELDKIPTNRMVTIDYFGQRTGTHGGVDDDPFGVEHRQHGGPVFAGRRYRVGERGPEDFIPSRSGRIEPNGSSGGGVDAKALAKAVADALHGTRVDVDGRQLGRLTIRHQPLAVAELGGRR